MRHIRHTGNGRPFTLSDFTMPNTSVELDHAVFAKTALGQEEIQSRALKLGPMVRRLLILIDGKRDGRELKPMIGGQDLRALIDELLTKGCIERVSTSAATSAASAAPSREKSTATTPTTAAAAAASPADAQLADLPAAETRSAADVTMACNFMTNTVNTIFQPYTRLTLLEAIANCNSAQDARQVYVQWAETIGSSAIGAKRLPEFREKLFKVL